ncbi:hypothetical protein [Paraflavitalea speifideaquila]|uniref:hypothetical protein n=1 Tax=Paraflavitalea speifideaquila TaxID=3076558 RepID=UPI0028EAEDD0|nr:hypothetical protein [Paraflavitalea speifideiaquila]
MKEFLFYMSCIILLLQTQCKGQTKSASYQLEKGTFQLHFEQYEVDSCFSDLLNYIALADSSHSRFPPDLYYYSSQFDQATSYSTITIVPERWTMDVSAGCSGIDRRRGNVVCLLWEI